MRLKIHHLSVPTGDGDAPSAFFRDPHCCKPALGQNDRTDPDSFHDALSLALAGCGPTTVSRNRQESSTALA
jgi:hypothetical protein